MRIAIDVTWATKRLGGISEYTHNLLKGLAAVDTKNQYELVYFYFSKSDLRPLPALPKNFRINPIRLPSKVYQWITETSHFPTITSFTGPVDAYLAPHFFCIDPGKVPLYVTIHDVSFLRNPDWFTPQDVLRFSKASAAAINKAAGIFAVSTQTKNDLIELTNTETPITVSYQGCDVGIPPLDTDDILTKYGLQKGQYLLFLGTLEPRKNIAGLLDAYEQHAQHNQLALPLVLAGRKGWLDEETFKRIETTAGVTWVGPVSDVDRSALLAGAQIFIYPSLYEGFGLPVLEAMTLGTPVITSNQSSLPEVAGDAAWLVDPVKTVDIAGAITKLSNDQELRTTLGQRGLAQAQKFTWDHTARIMIETLEKHHGA